MINEQALLFLLLLFVGWEGERRFGGRSTGAVLCAAASKVGEAGGGLGTGPSPSGVSPSSGGIERGDEEEADDDEHTAWLSSTLGSSTAGSFALRSDGGTFDDYEAQESDKQEEEGEDNSVTPANGEESESEDVEGEEGEDDDDDSLEALLSAPQLEDKRAQSSWVHRFCHTPGHEFFCAVPASFLAEEFNWLGLLSDLAAIDLLLGNLDKGKGTKHHRPPLPWDEAAARRMYGLIHARFIVTQKGLNAMRDKFEQAHFGRCPRLACSGQALLPVGVRDEEEGEDGGEGDEVQDEGEEMMEGPGHGIRNGGINVYCPRCRELYRPADPRHQQLNGAYWGTSFAHLFMLAFPDLFAAPASEEQVRREAARHSPVTTRASATGSRRGKEDAYVPRVFGFRVEGEEEAEEGITRQETDVDKMPLGGPGRGHPPPVPSYRAIQRLPPEGKPFLPLKKQRVIKTRLSFWEISRLLPWPRTKWRRRR